MYNEVFEHKIYLPLDIDEGDLIDSINEVVYCDLYSFFVGRKNDNIVVKTVVSSNSEWNTLQKLDTRDKIVSSIIDYIITLSDVKCIAFGQPPLELMIKLYQPMLLKMAVKLNHQWKHFEIEDLVATGNYLIVKLHKAGYYINKSILWTSLNNEVLMSCRKFRYQPNDVSFEDMAKSKTKIDDEKLTYGDMLKDESYEEEKERDDEQQLEKYIFEQVKSIVIEKVGQRRWDQIWRDYGKGHTTQSSQGAMRHLKEHFKELGLTRQDFINHYRR